MGTPGFAVPSLEKLAEAHDIVAVYSQPPRRSGRGMETRPSPVQASAERLGIDVATPAELGGEQVRILKDLSPEFLVVVAYGLILPESVLAVPGRAAINGHASLLPRWRGAAPVQRAIAAGDGVTGTTVMMMAKTLDSGPMLLSKKEQVRPDDTSESLHGRLADLTAAALVEAIEGFDGLTPKPQDETKVTWAGKISPKEAEIDFSLPADAVERRIRAFAPNPGAWFSVGGKGGGSMRVKVLSAVVDNNISNNGAVPGIVMGQGAGGGPLVATADAAVELTSVQPQGKAAMEGAAFLNGYELPPSIGRSGGSA